MTEGRAADVALLAELEPPRRGRPFRTVVRAVLMGVATLWVASLLTFFVSNLTGVDPATAALGRFLTDEQVHIFREQQGLDRPVLARYWVWLERAAVGDWGISLSAQTATSTLVLPRMARSILLAVAALLVALPAAFLIGGLAARRAGGKLDNVLSTATLFVIGLPEFVVGLVLLYLLAAWLKWLPPDSTGVSFGGFGAHVEAYVLPTLTLAVLLTPYMARMVRTAVHETLSTPYIQAAILRGVAGTRLFVRHVLPNAIGPVINVIALSLAEVLAGIVVVENVFGFPGLGQLMVYSVSTSDTAVIQICVMVAATGFVVVNLAADAAVVLLNPRLRRRQA